jgi:hypothetical protein
VTLDVSHACTTPNTYDSASSSNIGRFGGLLWSFPCRALSPATVREFAECLNRFMALRGAHPRFSRMSSPPTSDAITSCIRYRPVQDFASSESSKRNSFATAASVPAYDIPPYSSYDTSAGIAKGPWSVQLYGQNITNVNTPLAIDSAQYVLTEVPPRPRVLGIQFDYRFTGAK